MLEEINILHLEDNSLDEELIHSILLKEFEGCKIDTVMCKKDYEGMLKKNKYDLILADYDLPSYDGLSALKVTQKMKVDAPFIFVTGKISEDIAIDAMKEGATDYVFKDKLKKLVPAIQRAMNECVEKKARNERDRALQIKEYAIESSLVAIVFTDFKGIITYANASFVELLGYKNKDEIINKGIKDFLDIESCELSIKKLLNKDFWKGELVIKRADDAFLKMFCLINAVKDSKGKPVCGTLSFIDFKYL